MRTMNSDVVGTRAHASIGWTRASWLPARKMSSLGQSCSRNVVCWQTCRKQYKTAMEMEAHLSSYDHHHTKVTCSARRKIFEVAVPARQGRALCSLEA